MPLLSLPLEIIQQIFECVETLHRASLFSFSLTSKACHKASAFLLFRRLAVIVKDRDRLQDDVNTLLSALSRTDSAREVQCLCVKGALQLKPTRRERDSDAVYPHWRRVNWLEQEGLVDILPDEEPNCYHNSYVVYDQGVPGKSSDDEVIAWGPVVTLLRGIPRLQDLIWDCETQFPPCLLETLHERLPHCRLHHKTFRFRTLLWGVPYPYEMQLATSSSLHSLKLTCARRDSDGDDDFNLEAVRELVTLAPNLKDVTVLHIEPYDTKRFDFRRRDAWQGLPGYTPEARGSLTSLSLKGCGRLLDHLGPWARYTDFMCLQHLTLGGSYQYETYAFSGADMEWLVQTHAFPRLSTLCVSLTRDDRFLERPHYSAQAASFFGSFPPLTELSVHGPLDDPIFSAILARHGPTLEKLQLRPLEERGRWHNGRARTDIPMQFSAQHLRDMERRCPRLAHLALPIKRHQSRPEEVALYRCFGDMRALRTLFLTLDCAEWRVTRDASYAPPFTGTDADEEVADVANRRLLRGTVKEMLVNCAVDEALVRSIWGVVAAAKKGAKMELLKLWTRGGGEFGDHNEFSISRVTKVLSRSWVVEKGAGERGEEIVVRDVERYGKKSFLSEKSVVGQVFREMWGGEEREDWENVWRSVPLEV
ncbi:uncharacterized protein CC84DRAFT_1253945 [Paraphaeosphaeria sporulosa]|uniref:F-box domain-containing protein n=1 Tax=Paraphaeosphaeria sporulosa TaxID=1460663 RepID=A0A177CXP6_9PLEO|nr:uncharacterized protein CC84DRAFT_1253945 [Paraphaeosphaeria sporulosa]OAG11489.1 hypothetical protein CC84DRAFT_1253945 [Paraphaeosphaeria sporulosa]